MSPFFRVDQSDPKKTACYDIDVEIEDPLKVHMSHFAMGQASANEIQALGQKIYETVDQINEWKIRRDFYLGFAEDPQGFIQKWLISQSKDLKTMTEVEGQPETERKADFFHQPWLQEATFRYYYSKVQQKRAELEQSLNNRIN